MQPTVVFSTAGLDGRAIDSKSLLNFGWGLTLKIKHQIYLQQNIFNRAFVRAGRAMNILPSQILFRWPQLNSSYHSNLLL